MREIVNVVVLLTGKFSNQGFQLRVRPHEVIRRFSKAFLQSLSIKINEFMNQIFKKLFGLRKLTIQQKIDLRLRKLLTQSPQHRHLLNNITQT
ncbi:hypothetical protein D3C87_1853910 [compost metagenome]